MLEIDLLGFVEVIKERATNANFIVAIKLKVGLAFISALYSLRAMLYL